MTDESRGTMPSDNRYSRQNTTDSCGGKSDVINDVVSVTVSGSASNSPSNSLDRSICGSLGTDEVASCAGGDDCSTSGADADDQALLEKLQHANRFVLMLEPIFGTHSGPRVFHRHSSQLNQALTRLIHFNP